MLARDRIRQVVEKWFLVEPLLFAVWTTHALSPNPLVRNIRVHQGQIEFNPAFIDGLSRRDLEQVLVVEAMRIVLKHPYARKPENSELAFAASNLTLQEYLETTLPLPRARDIFGSREFDRQYYEFYYRKLTEGWLGGDQSSGGAGNGDDAGAGGLADAAGRPMDQDRSEIGQAGPSRNADADGLPALSAYADPAVSGQENAEQWASDDLQSDQIDDRIRTAAETGSWGSVPGRAKERILASLRPKLSYRSVLREFRASVLSVERRLTRMKPNRRYGFQYLGSHYEFTTRLLFAVDVSGSMTSRDLAHGFSVINRFFKYGVRSIDVIQFDTEIQGAPTTLRRARRAVDVKGRGGTSFGPVVAFVDNHPEYDGAIIFTDGIAPVPARPKNRRTRVLWLFNSEETYRRQSKLLRPIGRAAFLKVGPADAPA